jgi:serine protease
VTQLRPLAVPNDSLFSFQWNLTNAVSGINAPAAWDITTGTGIVVGVIDTGILPLHPDLAGKVLPGFDMISDPTIANDGDGRDADAFDSGDWLEGHDCNSADPIFEQSSWHGSHVAGIIAANANNEQGIAGINWGARILPVRTLGKCGGTDFDVADSILWAVGVPVANVPINPYPAQVLNLSLGGEGACPGYVQQAIDSALARGVAVVVAAGNNAVDVASFTPANCRGVITVAAHNIVGNRAFYSNFGPQIEISAPGGEFWSTQGVLSTISSGPRTALDYNYAEFEGTSMAAPHVTGVASLMLSKNPNLTPGQVLTILQQSARAFPASSTCTSQLPDPTQPPPNVAHLFCGAGMVDAAAALNKTPAPTSPAAVSGTVTVTELFNTGINRYFLTANAAELQALLQPASGWQLTGQSFHAYVLGTTVPSGTLPVCRFYNPGVIGSNSHFYTLNPGECALVSRFQGWIYEGLVFNALPAQGGICPGGTVPLFRVNNSGADHRFTTSASIRAQMLALAWLDEGVAMCLPQ